jgi:hypothetical protein
MAFLIFRCGACGEAVKTIDRPQYRGDQEVMTPLRCKDCKAGRAKPAAARPS